MTESRQRPASGGEPLRVLQITDTHLSAATDACLGGVNTEVTCAEVFELAASDAAEAELLLLTGDLVQDGSAEAYRRLQARVEGLRLPALAIPGNHDVGEVMAPLFREGNSRWLGHRVLGNWLVVMLDSTVPGKAHGHLTETELDRLDSLLAAHPEHHALLCLHHQPVAVGSDWIDAIGVDNGEALFKVVDPHPQVRAMLWGHVHQEFDSRRGGVRLLASPSTCVQFAPGSRDFALGAQPPGYRWLDLFADGRLETGVRRLDHLPGNLDLALGGY